MDSRLDNKIATQDGAIIALERHYAPQELAELWGLDASTVRRIFQDEPGVLKIGRTGRRDGKRGYLTLRIPQSVVELVHGQRSK